MSDPLDELSRETARIQKVGGGLSRQWLYENRIVIYTMRDIHRETVDAWTEAVTYDVNNWSADRPLLTVHNFLEIDVVSFSPYIASRSRILTALAPNHAGRTAIMMPRSMVAKIAAMFLKVNQNKVRPRQIFFDFSEGMAWMKEVLGA